MKGEFVKKNYTPNFPIIKYMYPNAYTTEKYYLLNLILINNIFLLT